MENLVRVISDDGSVMACAVDGTLIAGKIEEVHKTSAVVTAALGRLSIAGSMMGYLLKGEGDTLTLRINGGGPSGSLIAVANSRGDVKSYTENNVVEIPLNAYGKLDVRGAVGTNGTLSVVKDLGMKEPYIGQVPIASGEIAEDITSYYATSEQTPTVCGLGVLVNPDLTVRAAGGYLVQLLPFADEGCIDIIEENLKRIESVSTMIDKGVTPLQICEKLLSGLNPHLLDKANVEYSCDCSKERVERALVSIGAEELARLSEEEESCEVACHFCNKKYVFSKEALKRLLINSTSR